MPTPAAYVRKSHKEAASAAAQLVSIQELAARQGISDLTVYQDVGVSGRHGKRGVGSDWHRLQEDIAAGKVSVVYVTALDRAGRSLREWLDFTALCVEHHVEVRDQSGQNRADGDNEDIAIIEMMMAQREGRKAVERSARAKVTQQRRGDEVIGGNVAPYGWRRERQADGRIVIVRNPAEPLEPLREAIAATRGNVLAAAKLLSSQGINGRDGNPWNARTLGRVLDRAGIGRARRGSAENARRHAPTSAPLSRLVACHCGTLMTPVRDRRTDRWSELYCAAGHRLGVAQHGRYVARSRFVMDTLRGKLPRTKSIAILKRPRISDAAEQRAALDAKRRRIGMAFADGALDEETYREQIDAVKQAITDLDDATDNEWIGFGPLTPTIPWDGPDEALGDALRERVRVVKLDAEMLPAMVELRSA